MKACSAGTIFKTTTTTLFCPQNSLSGKSIASLPILGGIGGEEHCNRV